MCTTFAFPAFLASTSPLDNQTNLYFFSCFSAIALPRNFSLIPSRTQPLLHMSYESNSRDQPIHIRDFEYSLTTYTWCRKLFRNPTLQSVVALQCRRFAVTWLWYVKPQNQFFSLRQERLSYRGQDTAISAAVSCHSKTHKARNWRHIGISAVTRAL